MRVTAEDVVGLIKASSITTRNPEELSIDEPLRDQEVDSLEHMSIVLALEDEYGIRVPDEDFERLRSIVDMVAYINKLADA